MLPVSNSFFPSMGKFFDDDFNSFFDWTRKNFASSTSSLPSVNIKDTDDAYVVEMAAPGLKKEDFEISLNNNLLTIRSESKHETEDTDSESAYTRREFSYRSFQRTFNLNNESVRQEDISAAYEDGILLVTLPKKEEAKEKPVRLIEIG